MGQWLAKLSIQELGPQYVNPYSVAITKVQLIRRNTRFETNKHASRNYGAVSPLRNLS
jgi:hypothetical protein